MCMKCGKERWFCLLTTVTGINEYQDKIFSLLTTEHRIQLGKKGKTENTNTLKNSLLPDQQLIQLCIQSGSRE